MTEKLYYQDVYMREFDAGIEEVGAEGSDLLIRLDRTAFYPEGGGQGADTGKLFIPVKGEDCDISLKVTDVQDIDGEIWHRASIGGCVGDTKGAFSPADIHTTIHQENNAVSETLNESQDIEQAAAWLKENIAGTLVHGVIDWERRFDHMQQHSGEHIISGMICKAFDCDNVGFHMGEDTITIDYNARIDYEALMDLEAQANKYIWENHPCMESWPQADELQNMTYRSKKEIEGDVRIISFPGADTCACCGTHVAASAQVGLIHVVSAKNFHEGTRIEIYCGKRAWDFLCRGQRANKQTAVLLSTAEEHTPSRVKHLIEENIELKSQAVKMEERLISLMAEQLILDAHDGKYIVHIDDDLSPEQGRKLADSVAAQASVPAAVFTKTDGGYRYAVIHKGHDISALVKDMNAALSGRGGGRDGFAQGSVAAEKAEIIYFFK